MFYTLISYNITMQQDKAFNANLNSVTDRCTYAHVGLERWHSVRKYLTKKLIITNA